jgi:predicted DNA-binding protein (UPF0251 family)
MPRRWCYRWRRCGINIPIESSINIEDTFYIPIKPTSDFAISNYVELYDYEVEAFALIHYEGLTTDEAATRMKLSKTTFWRILEQTRFKLAKALIERKPIKIVSTKHIPQEFSQQP